MIDRFLREALNGLADIEPELLIPKHVSQGDISSPVAMSLAKTLKRPPVQIAREIIEKIGDREEFEKIEAAGAGFINFWFSRKFLAGELRRLYHEREAFLRPKVVDAKSVLIEFVSANPTGPLHLGHGRGAALGAALSNLLAFAGYNVTKEFYINDAGRQVKLLGESVFHHYKALIGEDVPFPDDGYRGEYVLELARDIQQDMPQQETSTRFDGEVRERFIRRSVETMLSDIRDDLEKFGVIFDIWQSERELYDAGEVKNALDGLMKNGYIYEADGAVWFKSTIFGDEKDRVIVKANGEYTYLAPDIAYHAKKGRTGYDMLVNIWGADHHGYVARVKAALKALGYRDNLKVILVQMVSLLKDGAPVQMSKRTGEFVTLKEVYEEIGPDTAKFIFLTRRSDSQLEFDLSTVKRESSENPVFYIQYAYARISSINKKAAELGVSIDGDTDPAMLVEPEEAALIKKLIMYPMTFQSAAREFEPHRITFYLQELAGLFHPFYNRHKVLCEDFSISQARLMLCACVRLVIEEGLKVLGISAPERM